MLEGLSSSLKSLPCFCILQRAPHTHIDRPHLWEKRMSQEEQDSHGVNEAESGSELTETKSQRLEHILKLTLYLGLKRGEVRGGRSASRLALYLPTSCS